MALVDFTALVGLNDYGATATKAVKDAFPVSPAEPAGGTQVDYWRKIRIDFSKTNLATADWAKFAVIPAGTYMFEVMTQIIVAEANGSAGITIGDASADSSTTWVATQAGTAAGTVTITLVADTNGATRGKYYGAAGALYISGTAIFSTLVIDVYVHAMKMDAFTETLTGSTLYRTSITA